jgi:hypothetical protein
MKYNIGIHIYTIIYKYIHMIIYIYICIQGHLRLPFRGIPPQQRRSDTPIIALMMLNQPLVRSYLLGAWRVWGPWKCPWYLLFQIFTFIVDTAYICWVYSFDSSFSNSMDQVPHARVFRTWPRCCSLAHFSDTCSIADIAGREKTVFNEDNTCTYMSVYVH